MHINMMMGLTVNKFPLILFVVNETETIYALFIYGESDKYLKLSPVL